MSEYKDYEVHLRGQGITAKGLKWSALRLNNLHNEEHLLKCSISKTLLSSLNIMGKVLGTMSKSTARRKYQR